MLRSRSSNRNDVNKSSVSKVWPKVVMLLPVKKAQVWTQGGIKEMRRVPRNN